MCKSSLKESTISLFEFIICIHLLSIYIHLLSCYLMSYPILFYLIYPSHEAKSWALRLGKFDLIVSAEGVLQSPCGAQALLRLSTLQTQVHLVLRGDGAEVQQQRFLLRNVFREESRQRDVLIFSF